MTAEEFATFNQNLFYKPEATEDQFVAVTDVANNKLQVSEVQHVLQKHFKANKSTGLSLLPLQCLKWMGTASVPILTDFINNTAVE